MNSIWHIALVLVAGLAIWLVIAAVFGLLLGRTIRLAEEIEFGLDSDEDAAQPDFVPPPNDVGKSISDERVDGEKLVRMLSPQIVDDMMKRDLP